MAPRSVQPFLQGPKTLPTDRHTDRQTHTQKTDCATLCVAIRLGSIGITGNNHMLLAILQYWYQYYRYFLPVRRYGSVGISSHRVSVCLSVCHAGIVSKRLSIG